jgi:hypothetical protein
VYLTLGNIPKEIRRKPSSRAYVLLGYLPTTNLGHITNKAARRRCLANLFHGAMNMILRPLHKVGATGLEISDGDGVLYRGHPIFASHISDYPEQLLVACCTHGDCPKCPIPKADIGKDDSELPLRNLKAILRALEVLDGDPILGREACRKVKIKPIFQPFWQSLPYSNVFRSITPDILHQLYQGMFKHLKNWVLEAYGAVEIDARCRRLPPNHNICVFMKGLSTLNKVTGQEHQQISQFLLGLIVDLPLPGATSGARLVAALRSFLDFLYLARYTAHSDQTLKQMEDALKEFHIQKSVFVDLGVREHFKLPKLHSLNHYISAIRDFGTTDNTNTETTERLHIDMAKDAYRATN